jgi:hypothetical protein
MAFALLQRDQLDLLLLDIVMPAISGRCLTEKNLGLGLLTRFRSRCDRTRPHDDQRRERRREGSGGAERGSGGRPLQADWPA